MDIGLKIKELSIKEKIEIPELASKLGKSKQAVYDMLSKKDLNTSVLRELASIFNIPLTAFFQEDVDDRILNIQGELDSARQEIENLRIEVEYLRSEKRSHMLVQEQPAFQPDPITNERLLSIIESQQRTIENLSKR